MTPTEPQWARDSQLGTPFLGRCPLALPNLHRLTEFAPLDPEYGPH